MSLISVCGGILFLAFVFFFFQAEDGIRDHCVTGVQTCALPISELQPGPDAVAVGRDGVHQAEALGRGERKTGDIPPGSCRSEERRVGKECRSRWWGEQ